MCESKSRKLFILMFIITTCTMCITFTLVSLFLPANVFAVIFAIALISMVVATSSLYILNKEIKSGIHIEKIIDENVISSTSNLEGVITDVSEAFCKISGYTKDELIGHSHNILRHKDMPAFTFIDLWETLKKGKTWTGEVKNLKKDGRFYWVEATISRKYDSDNNHIGYISVRQDITNKKRFELLNDNLEEKIREEVEDNSKKEKIIFESEKMVLIGEMIGNIAHQWRQPLTVISAGATGLLMQKEYDLLTDEKFDKACNDINDNAQYLSETIDTFKNFIKDEKQLIEVVLQDRIDKAIHIVEPNLKSQFIELNNNIDYSNPIKATIIVGELAQVIINIMNNAKDILVEKNIEEPYINIELYVENNNAILTIEDNGGGIPFDVMPRIFEPYFTTKHESIGTGLGLHMSYKIVTESLKGKIYAKNTDVGAKFFIELPLENK